MRLPVHIRAVAVVAAVSVGGALLSAQTGRSVVADAAMAKDATRVKSLLKTGADANAAQGDGMTALHWAAMNGDGALAEMLLVAGASPRATTRIGGFTALHLASQAGRDAAVPALIKGGAEVDARTSTGATALMLAAASGNAAIVEALAQAGATLDLVDTALGQTALMYGAGAGRTEAVKALLARGARLDVVSHVVDLSKVEVPEEVLQDQARQEQRPQADKAAAPAPAPAARPTSGVAGMSRPFKYNELIGKHGGLAALHFAARQGAFDTAAALVAAGANVNAVSAGDKSSPMVIAAINGHFDLMLYLLSKGGDPNLAAENGMTPLYAVLNMQWQPKSFYPQPRAYLQQKAGYLEAMKSLLDKGADPNARTTKKVWYTQYNFDLLRVDDQGATPFWRAAYALDVDAMKLLAKYGADPDMPSMTYGAAKRGNDPSGLDGGPTGGPHVPPFHAASGVGYGTSRVAQQHRHVPDGWMPAAKYFLEELKVDVNMRDADGFTALHHAAARGDNEMVKYLVSKGADVKAVNRAGQTTVDMANSPEQRTQPFPETIALLESMGGKNNHNCRACK